MNTKVTLQGIIIWVIVAFFVTYQFLLQTSPSIMIDDLEVSFHLDKLGVGLLSSSFFYTYIVLQIPAGLIVDRCNLRWLMVGCFLALGLSTVIFSVTHLTSIAFASRFLMGIVAAPSVVCTLYVACRWFPPHIFGFLAGAMEMLGMVGGAAGQALLASLVHHHGWQHTLQACAAAGLGMAILSYCFVRENPLSVHCPKTTSIKPQLMAVIKKKDIWLAGIYSSLMFAIITGFAGLWAIPFLQTKFDVSLTHAALASSMVFAGAGVGAVFFGWLSDKVGLRCLPMQLGALGVFAILVILIYRPHLPFHACFILLLFLGFFSGTYAIPFALVRDLTPPAQQGTAMGFTNMMCIIIGAPILQPLLGWLLHLKNLDMNLSVQDFRICFMILPGLMIVAFAMALWIGETHCRETT